MFGSMRMSCPQHTCLSTRRGTACARPRAAGCSLPRASAGRVPGACARCVACAWVHGCACHSRCAWHRQGIERVHDRRPNGTIRFYTWRRGHAEMQRFQVSQHDTAHCSGSDADVRSAASAGARTRPLVRTFAVHSPHATRHCSSVAQTARIFFAAKSENPNCDTRNS